MREEMILSSPAKAPPHDEQDVGRVDLQEFLLRMLAPALRRHGGNGAFHDLEQRLLHALARHVAGDRRVVGLAADLVDFVDIDDAALRPLDIVVGDLQQLEDDVLDVLADIAGFGQRRGVGHGEGHVEDARQRLGQQRLAAARGADQHDVRFGQFDVAVLAGGVDALVVVVDRDREHLLGVALADHIIVEDLEDLRRRGHAVARLHEGGLVLLADDLHAQFDAFIADEHRRARNQLADLVLALAAEGAVQRVLGLAAAGLTHGLSWVALPVLSDRQHSPNPTAVRSSSDCTNRANRIRLTPTLSFDHDRRRRDQDLFNSQASAV